MSHACHRFGMLQNPHVLLIFDKVHNPLCLPRETTLNVQKRSVPVSFLHFWLGNALCATTACTFSTCQLPKAVRHWSVLYILPWTCTSRHNGVQLLISHLARWLRTRHFSEPTFRPSGATNHWKNTVATFLPFCAPASFLWLFLFADLLSSSFLLLLFSSLLWLFPPLFFHLSILSEVWLLNFLRWQMLLVSGLQSLDPLSPLGLPTKIICGHPVGLKRYGVHLETWATWRLLGNLGGIQHLISGAIFCLPYPPVWLAIRL